MVVNYQREMEKILNNLSGKPKLLLHACCGVCSSYVLECLSDFFDITVLYYNPNIYPLTEYNKRLDNLKKLIGLMDGNFKLLVTDYTPDDFDKISKGLEDEKEGGTRCSGCYRIRLEKTAMLALKNGFDFFCTTLSISPYKNAQKLNEIGFDLANRYGVKYLYSDFKKKDGFKRANELSSFYDLYRQDYCGCKFSLKASNVYKKRKNDVCE